MSDIVSELKKLKVQELRDRLAAKGLDTTGVKDVLVARLAEAEQSTEVATEVVDETAVQSEVEVEATEEVAAEAHDEEASAVAVEAGAESAPVESSVDAEMQKRAERGLIFTNELHCDLLSGAHH